MTQNVNQFGQTPLKGMIAAIANPFTLSVNVDPDHDDATPIVPGDAVVLTSETGKMIFVDKCVATDVPFGYVVYVPKKSKFYANDSMEIVLLGSIIYVEANAAITRGNDLEFVPTGSKVKTNAGVNPISGVALDNASTSGDLIRMIVKTSISFSTAFTGGSINNSAIGQAVPAAGKFTKLQTVVTALTPSATVSVDPTLGGVFTLTPGEDETINAASVVSGQRLAIIITTSGTTSRTLTFSTNFKTTGTLATGSSNAKVFVIEFVSDGTSYKEVSRTTAM